MSARSFTKSSFAAVIVALLGIGMMRGNGDDVNLKNAEEWNTMTDLRDDKKYKTVTIGSQIWMAENLDYDASYSWCYDHESSNCAKYGRLYDWNTAMAKASSSSSNPSGVRGVCPIGWHLPSNAEWGVLLNFVGGMDISGTKLKSKSGCDNSGGNGTDEYGFSALLGGAYYWRSGSFGYADEVGFWWTASQSDGNNAWYLFMDYNYQDVVRNISYKDGGFSVRCVKD